MKLLVLPDIHNNFIRAQSIIESVPHDKVVLLGDYFDSFGDSITLTENTANWLKEKVLDNPNIIALLGNHDTQYIWNDNVHFRCSGFADRKNAVISEILTPELKRRFKTYYAGEGYVFTHAGVSNQIWKWAKQRFPENPGKPHYDFFVEVLEELSKEAINDADHGRDTQLFAAGWDRGGFARHGGINWVDWNHFSPVNGINQIVGHTRRKIPSILVQKEGGSVSSTNVLEYYKRPYKGKTLSVNYCLDTALGHYAVVENGDVRIYDHINQIDLREVAKYAIPASELNSLT